MVCLLIFLVIVGCSASPSIQTSFPTPIPAAVDQVSELEQVQILPTESAPIGLHFSGQGPTTFPIEKDLGMALIHLKVEDCQSSLVLSKKGQNIPYMPVKVLETDQFEDQYQFFNEFSGLPSREETVILDDPTPYDDFGGASPQTEMLRIQEVSQECKWNLTILPMSAARTLSPGQTISGMHDDVLSVSDGLQSLELLFMSPEHSNMLQDFRGLYAIGGDGTRTDVMPYEDSEYYDFQSLPPGTEFLEIYSIGYWELLGK